MNIITMKDRLLEPLVRLIPQNITPNTLSWWRLFLAVPLCILLIVHALAGAFIVFIAAIVLDLIDGTLARLRHQTSEIGAALDPLADKFIMLPIVIFLIYYNVSLRLFVAIVFIETLALLGAVIIPLYTKVVHGHEASVQANIFGQIKTAAYGIGIGSLFFIQQMRWLESTANVSFAVGVLCGIASMVVYLVQSTSVTRRS